MTTVRDGAKPTDQVANFFSDGQEFEDLLDEAAEGVDSDDDQEFCDAISERWENYGMRAFLSQRQLDRLNKLAGRVV